MIRIMWSFSIIVMIRIELLDLCTKNQSVNQIIPTLAKFLSKAVL